MPLKSGKEAVGENISEMMKSPTFAEGKSRKKKHEMAIVAAMNKARESGIRKTLGKKKKEK